MRGCRCLSACLADPLAQSEPYDPYNQRRRLDHVPAAVVSESASSLADAMVQPMRHGYSERLPAASIAIAQMLRGAKCSIKLGPLRPLASRKPSWLQSMHARLTSRLALCSSGRDGDWTNAHRATNRAAAHCDWLCTAGRDWASGAHPTAASHRGKVTVFISSTTNAHVTAAKPPVSRSVLSRLRLAAAGGSCKEAALLRQAEADADGPSVRVTLRRIFHLPSAMRCLARRRRDLTDRLRQVRICY